MVALLAIITFTFFLIFFLPLEPKSQPKSEKSPKLDSQMKKLWQLAQTSMRDRKPLRAEKALLAILKFDEKNAAAYNRLGILYAKSQKWPEAVECFEIAQSLDNNPASIHNVGLIYLETGAYEKAAIAFRQAIELEGDIPARHIALAKAEEKLGSPRRAIESLENAYAIDPKITTLRQILAIYEGLGDAEAIATTSARIEERIVENSLSKSPTPTKKSSPKAPKSAPKKLPKRPLLKSRRKVI